jgi:cobalamin-dependent methionine synthase I
MRVSLTIYDDIDPGTQNLVEDVILNRNGGPDGDEAEEKLLEAAPRYAGQGKVIKDDKNDEWRQLEAGGEIKIRSGKGTNSRL